MLEKGRLSASATANDVEQLSSLHGERDVFQNWLPIVMGGQVPYFD
jgi:hypothetical protein